MEARNDFIVAPREFCQSCGRCSGPKFFNPNLGGSFAEVRINTAPSTEEERISILDTIAQADLDIYQLNDEVSRLQQTIIALEERRDELRWFKKDKQSLLAPIRRLPDNLLQDIFLLCQTTNTVDNKDFKNLHGFIEISNPRTFVRIITQVCAYWRSLSIDLSHLWSRIFVGGDNKLHDMNKFSRFIEECIVQSKQRSLQIEFGHWRQVNGSCVQAIAQSAYRWETMGVYWDLLQEMSRYIPANTQFTYLRSLSIVHCNSEEPCTIPFNTATQLKSFKIIGIRDTLDLFTCFPSGQITHFTCGTCRFFGDNSLTMLLETMPNLIFLTLKSNQCDESGISRPALLSQLQHLTIRDLSSISALHALTAPRLQTLDVDCEMIDSDDMARVIWSFLRRSGCSLNELSVTGEPLLTMQPWDCEEFKSVRRLDVHWTVLRAHSLPEAFESINYIFPRLELLYMKVPSGINMIAERLISMLKSRLAQSRILGNITNDNGTGESFPQQKIFVIYKQEIFEREDKVKILKDFIQSDSVKESGIKIIVRRSIEPEELWLRNWHSL